MAYILEASCMCHTGRMRKNNEDNFFFDGRSLPLENSGLRHPVCMTKVLRGESFLSVFDGMGGEAFGEVASFTAADIMRQTLYGMRHFFVPEKTQLNKLCQLMNEAVVAQQDRLCVETMGTTVTTLCFTHRDVYVCNVGDSRAYRLRAGEFLQISIDHVAQRAVGQVKKAPITQYLGIRPEEFRLEPHIAKGELQRGDKYLLCSDGLTDMLTNYELADIMEHSAQAENSVQELVDAALEKGGKDNITAIVCHIL